MGTTLEHGIYLPSEGERNCYDGLALNWRSVDTNIGYISALRQAIAGALTRKIVTELPTEDIDPNCIYMILKTTPQTNNVYDGWMYISNAWELIGDTQLDLSDYYTKQEVNQLPAVASGVTSTKVGNYDAHIANGDIHVTASDKAKWNTVVLIKQLRLVNTQVGSATTIAFANIDDTNGIKVGDKCMDLDAKLFEITAVDTTNQTVTVGSALVDIALDANVVHTSGNETVGGKKELSEITTFAGSSLGNEGSNNARTCMYSYCNRDTKDYSGIYQRRVRQNREQGSMSGSDISQYAFDVLENQVRTNNVLYFVARDFVDDVPQTVYLTSQCTNRTLGSSNYAWSAVYSDTYYYGNIEFSDKFVTTDTAQTISGLKDFTDYITIDGDYLGGEASTNQRTNICLRSNRDTAGKSCAYITRFRQNRAQGSMNPLDLHMIGFDVVENEVRTNNVLSIQCTDWLNDVPQRVNIVCGTQSYSFGDSTRKALINGLTPSSLSLPDLDNGVDISSYITDLTGASNINKYTPTVNGWISVGLSNAEFIELYIPSALMGGTFTKSSINNYAQAFIPAIANKEVRISLKGASIGWAKFYPCLGNV